MVNILQHAHMLLDLLFPKLQHTEWLVLLSVHKPGGAIQSLLLPTCLQNSRRLNNHALWVHHADRLIAISHNAQQAND